MSSIQEMLLREHLDRALVQAHRQHRVRVLRARRRAEIAARRAERLLATADRLAEHEEPALVG